MELTIANLLKRYETGGVTRRELVRSLTLIATGTAATTASAQSGPPPIPWEPLIDHMQINSRDPRKSAEFYQKVIGLDLLRVGPAGPERNCCPDRDAFFGVGKRLILAIRKREPVGALDHWSLLAPGYSTAKFEEVLKQRGGGLTKHDLGGTYVQDPDGVLCQLMGQPGAP